MNQQVDLLPGGYRARDVIRERALRCFLIVLIVVVIIAAAGFLLKWQVAEMDAKVKQLRANVAAMESWEQMILPLAVKLEKTSNQRVVVDGLLAEAYWPGLLSDIAAGAGNSIRIRSLKVYRQKPTGELGEPGTAARTVITLVGQADSNADIVRFVKALSRAPQLKGVTLVRSQRAEADEPRPMVLNFDIEGTLDPRAGADSSG
jgi:hypothetical protein